jgi:hypothetical protein
MKGVGCRMQVLDLRVWVHAEHRSKGVYFKLLAYLERACLFEDVGCLEPMSRV